MCAGRSVGKKSRRVESVVNKGSTLSGERSSRDKATRGVSMKLARAATGEEGKHYHNNAVFILHVIHSLSAQQLYKRQS